MIRKTMSASKTKRLDFKLEKAVVTKNGAEDCIIEGYANTSSKDRVGDVVLPQAFEKTLKTYMSNPVLLVNHDWNDPCGVVLSAEVTDKGLWIKARVSDTREDIKTLIREGCLRTFSIGYNEVDCDYDDSTKTKYIKELELLEISIVTVPANTEAMFVEAQTKVEEESTKEQVTEIADESAKSAPAVRTAKGLQDYIKLVESVVSRELSSTETVAVCDYYTKSKEEPMTKEQLIAAFAKSAPTSVAPVANEAKGEEPAMAPEAGDKMGEILAKLDAIGQAMAHVLEMMEPKKSEEQKLSEEEEKLAEEEKPAEEQKEMSEEKQGEEEEMSEEECEKQLLELEAEIAAIEDSEEL